MDYVIDVTRERVRKAMVALGIEESELIRKREEDFSAKNKGLEIKQLRFMFFCRKQQELVRHIKGFMREEYLRNSEKLKEAQQEDSLSESLDDELKKTKEKHKKIIEKHLNSAQVSANESKAIEEKLKQGEKIRNDVKLSMLRHRTRLLQFKQKSLEQVSKSHEREDLSSFKLNLIPEKFPKKKPSSSKILTKSDEFDELETAKKIQEFEEKMERSKFLNESFIKSKQNAVLKLLKKPLNGSKNAQVNNDLVYYEKLLKIVQRVGQAENKKLKIVKMQTERKIQQKKIEDERRSKTRSKLDERNRDLEKKCKDIEDRMRRSEYVLGKKQEKWLKELELRNELQRLRDEETLLNAERKKRVSYYLFSKHRRNIILEKQLESRYKLQQIQDEKEDELKRKMEIANKNMMEKEKLYEAIYSINKTPESKLCKIRGK